MEGVINGISAFYVFGISILVGCDYLVEDRIDEVVHCAYCNIVTAAPAVGKH